MKMLNNFIFYLLDQDSFLSHLIDVFVLLLIIHLCYLFVEKFLSRHIKVRFSSALERFVFFEGIGLGLFAYAVFIFGMLGLLYKWAFVLLILTVVLLVLDRIIEQIERLKRELFKKIQLPVLSGLEIIIMSIGAVLMFLYTVWNFLGADFSWDDLIYHLAVPKLYIEHHQIFNIPLNMRSYWVMAQHMILVFCLSVRGVTLSRGFQCSLVLMASLAVYAFSRRYFPRWVALLAALFYISDPFILLSTKGAYIEVGLAFFEFLALFACIQWLERQEDAWLVLSGIFCGLALASKYTGAFSYIAIFLLILFFCFKHRASISLVRLAKKLMLFSLVVFLVSFVWYLKNYVYCGNPVLPYLNNIFKSPYWYRHFEIADYAGFTMGYSPMKILFLPWNVYLFAPIFGGTIKGIIFVAFIPLLFLLPFVKKVTVPPAIQYLIIYCFIRFCIFAGTAQYSRYLVPVFPMLAVLCAYAVHELVIYFPKFPSKILIGATLLMIVLNPIIFTIPRGYSFPGIATCIAGSMHETWERVEMSAGLMPPSKFISDYFDDSVGGGFVAARYVNDHLPRYANVFLIWTEFGFWYDRNYIYDLDYLPEIGAPARNSFTREFYPGMWKEGFYGLLKSLKITHVVINFHQCAWEHIDMRNDDFLVFKARHLRTIFNYRNFEVYELL
jgi:hypothetical protein